MLFGSHVHVHFLVYPFASLWGAQDLVDSPDPEIPT